MSINTEDNIAAKLIGVRKLLKDLLKVIKTVSTYPEDNPLPQRLKRDFGQQLQNLLSDFGSLSLTVERGRLSCEHEIVFADRSREESLSLIFFMAGINRFSFEPGIGQDEIEQFLDIFKGFLNSADQSVDLSAELWDANLTHFKFEMVEDISLVAYGDDFDFAAYLTHMDEEDSCGAEQPDSYDAIFQRVDSNVVRFSESGGVSIAREEKEQDVVDRLQSASEGGAIEEVDDDKTPADWSERSAELFSSSEKGESSNDSGPLLIFPENFRLSDSEQLHISKIVTSDASMDSFDTAISLVKELLYQETEMTGFVESLAIVDRLHTLSIQDARMVEAGRLIRFVRHLEGLLKEKRPQWAEKLREIYVTAGSRERLRRLAEALNDNPDVGATELIQYLKNFDWQALSNITDLLGEFKHRLHRITLCDYLTASGKTNIDIVAKGIHDKRWFVVRNSVMILGRIADAKALTYINRVVNHDEVRVRREVLEAVRECPRPEAAQLLKQLVFDQEPSISREAQSILLSRTGKSAWEALDEIVGDADGWNRLDEAARARLLKRYASLGGGEAVKALEERILRYNPTRNQGLAAERQAAFEALAENRSDEAEILMKKLLSSWRPDVRRQAAVCQRRRHQVTEEETT